MPTAPRSTFPAQLAALRRRGAVTDGTRVVAIHLGHRNPPSPTLDRTLAAWGAEAAPDGTVLTLPGSAAPTAPVADGTTTTTLVLIWAARGRASRATPNAYSPPNPTSPTSRPGRRPARRRGVGQTRHPAPGAAIAGLANRRNDVMCGRRWTTDRDPVLIDCLPPWLSGTSTTSRPPHALVACCATRQARWSLSSSEDGPGVVLATVLEPLPGRARR